MKKGSDEAERERGRGDEDDPFEEDTRSLSTDASPFDADTTTFASGEAPPVLVEEEPTVAAGSASAATPGPVSDDESTERRFEPADSDREISGSSDSAETVVHREPPSDPADAVPTVVHAADPLAEPEPEPEPEPERRTTSSESSVAPSAFLHPMLLERIDPSLGRGERLRLDGAHWRVMLGRAEHSDIRLYTASASREHAVIEGSAEGDWILTPNEGKRVLVDGAPIQGPVPLEVGMNVVLGGDHLRCVTEGLEREQMAAQTAAEGWNETAVGWLGRLGPFGWTIAAVALLGLALIAVAAL